MVVLELEGHTNMLGSGPNQYLQPDYLSPLASPLDSKVSPLALLAQTCSQIGADNNHSSKSMFDASKRKLSTCSESSIKSDSSSNDSTSNNNKEPTPTYTSKESRGGGSSTSNPVNNNNRPKSGSSSVSPMTKSSGSGGGGKSSPVLISPNTSSPAFKPYDIGNRHSNKDSSGSDKSVEKHLKATKHNSISRSSASVSPKVKTPNSRSTPENSSSSKEISVVDTKSGGSSKGSSGGSGSSSHPHPPPETSKSSSSSDHGASPIIRSGLEVLQQGQYGSQSSAIAEYNRKLSALSSLSALGGYPPAGFDPMNPAFRPPFMGPPHPHHAMGYAIPGGSPYVSYSRVKTASGAETIVPVCKDPYCTGCQYGGGGVPHGHGSGAGHGHLSASAGAAAAAQTMNGLMAAAAGYPSSLSGGIPVSGATSNSSAAQGLICPAGCVSCDHPKLPLSSLSHLFPPGLASSIASGGYPSSLLSQHVAAASQAQQNAQRPYVCNWIVGDNYCGKRFPSSEELLQHLRTHTNSSGANNSSSGPSSTSAADSAVLAAMVQQQNQLALGSSPSSSLYSSALLNQSAMAAAMHRTYPTPPLSPLSAARYHPYAAAMAGKASALSAGLHPSQIPPSSSVAAAAALSNYYAAALYGQRMGPSVHQ